MKIIFFGSDQFAVPSLDALVKNKFEVLCVVTQPDRRKGRHLFFSKTAVKLKANDYGLKLFQPQNINSKESISTLKSYLCDLFVVIAYGQILSSELLAIPRVFGINLHASLLPKYRGAAPINWALINSESFTGLSVMKLEDKMDAGPIINQEKIKILKDDNAASLKERLSIKGASLLIKSLEEIKNQKIVLKPQDETKATFARKLRKKDGLITWEKPAGEILNLIKGCFDWPGAYTFYKDKLLKVFKAGILEEPLDPKIKPGEIIKFSKHGIIVACGSKEIVIQELQLEGKRRMTAEDFLSGHKIIVGEKLGDKK